jgi:sulfhydrogenase subunit beta (sulfur reductase)
MQSKLATADRLLGWIRRLAADAEVFFPQPVGAVSLGFKRVGADSHLDPGAYRPTLLPPGKQLTPDHEVMFTFRRRPEGGIEVLPAQDRTTRILAGVRSCDLKAIAQLDTVFADGPGDPLYLQRRAHTAIIGWNCLAPCHERSFCAATGALGHRAGADVYVTEVAGGMLAESLTPRGEELLGSLEGEPSAEPQALRAAAEAGRPQPFGRQLRAAPEALPEILRDAYRSAVYERYAERCFSCGTCNLVCPTCYCFDVCDDLGLDAASGGRTRTWDACMNPEFASVAGGHSFRPSTGARHRHRVKRKFEYLPERYGLGSFCVGCGRCGQQCTTGIDIFDIVNDIVAESAGGGA